MKSSYTYRSKKTANAIVMTMTAIIKVIVGILFVFILFSLGRALYFLIQDGGGSPRMVKALSWRIGLSIFLLILLFIAFAFGWIAPHAVGR